MFKIFIKIFSNYQIEDSITQKLKSFVIKFSVILAQKLTNTWEESQISSRMLMQFFHLILSVSTCLASTEAPMKMNAAMISRKGFASPRTARPAAITWPVNAATRVAVP